MNNSVQHTGSEGAREVLLVGFGMPARKDPYELS